MWLQPKKEDDMRKFLLGLMAVLLLLGQVGFAQAATPGYRKNPGTGDILGQDKYQNDAHKIFRLVRYVQPSSGFAAAATLSAGSIVVWDTTNDDGVTVTTTTTSGDSAVAGIISTAALTQDTQNNTAAQDVGQDNWAWLQTYGYVSTAGTHATLGAIPVGGAFGTSATAGLIAGYVASTSDTRALGKAGFVYDTMAANATNQEVFLFGLD